ncbi:hypothetical protein [Marinobacter sp.]|uniref:hypothetical protein n=1 Tax=Marinobacter sp. TaxID=50741 RepID=UPI002B475D93|nr:hypothetical protein [Marinobacter sp.]HKK54877.1 hypothetical protein [Marinobacter sp.]
MEDWQGCLSPACQRALQCARDNVTRRGGHAITLEDFLLAMLDEIPELCRFLRRQGVDLDELTRTIQCEQPIVTGVPSDSLLSSQMIYWIHCAREVSGEVWLEWPTLLKTLVHSAERLQEKAFVAVLELVTCWPFTGAESPGDEWPALPFAAPLVTADAGWLGLAEEVSVVLSATPRGLVWVCGERGSGKSSWLRSLLDILPGGAIEMDIRRQADLPESGQSALPVIVESGQIAPALILDNVSPADLMTLMAEEFSYARDLVTSFPGPVLLLGPDSPDARTAADHLQRLLGRSLDCFVMADTGFSQRLAIVTAHQPLIEKRWRIDLAPAVVNHVAACTHPAVSLPGTMLQWLERAAARLSLFADRGPVRAGVLEARAETVRRQLLLALARQQPTDQLEHALEILAAERAASEAPWYERKREGTLRQLQKEDLQQELERRVAANGRLFDERAGRPSAAVIRSG